MVSNAGDFRLHDVSRFPLVLATGQAPAGYAAQWAREMQALVAHGRPFVLVHIGVREQETQEDRRQRGLWLKQHKAVLGRLCRALVSVESDPVRRLALAAQSALAEKAFGIPMRTAVTLAQACAEGLAALGCGAASG